MPLSAAFIPEGLTALFLNNKKNAVAGEFPIDRLFDMMSTFADLLKNEQLLYDFPW